ncbi:phosphatase PAP2 family protein [Streptomyces sp. DSM 42041]|uniref:Phosphatase PAP2 family protein n=1 Tax=Streptomyces hazeniae TaxID=3075538 RepID=A0ABU2NWS7_9ACTN|nr:phosphatase PAP2 family protein [Streptomyces sp. DSM 42041]MDT0381184.1 phosphatase PAP2 family protein [Streptomyces sp. DSM 42041]
MSAASRLPSSPPPAGAPSPRRAAPWVWASVCGGLGIALILLVVAGWPPLIDLDDGVSRTLHDAALSHPGWTGTARVLTDWVWDTVTMRVLVALAFVVLWWRGARALAFLLAVTMLLGVLVQQSLKALVGRERPQWENPVDAAHFAAMPSGHAMTAALACGLLTWVAWTRLHRPALCWTVTAVAAVSVAGVSLTRVFLGVHWLTDVVSGVALGLAMAALAAGSWQALRTAGKIAA